MAADNPKTIILHGRDDDRKDAEAAGAIDPGDLIEVSGVQTSGSASERQVQRHSSAPDLNGNGSALPRFALEYAKTGMGIDSAYASGDHVEYRTFEPGDEAYVWLAAGENASINDPLESAGDGALAVHAGSAPAGDGTDNIADDVVVAYAVEAVDNSGGGSKVRLRVEVA